MSDRGHRYAPGVVALVALMALAAPCAANAEGTPWWHLISSVRPANIAPGGEGTIVVEAINLGDAPTSGQLTLTDTLPAGVSVAEEETAPGSGVFRPRLYFSAFFASRGLTNLAYEAEFVPCQVVGQVVTCTLTEQQTREYKNEGVGGVLPSEDLEMRIGVKLTGPLSAPNVAEVSGGGAPPLTLSRPVPVGAGAPAFEVEHYEQVPEEEGGAVDAQAGSHPFQLTTTLALNQTSKAIVPPALEKDLQFKLPPGLVANATALPQCSEEDFRKILSEQNFCPPDTAIGVATITFDEPAHLGLRTYPLPIFNLAPSQGEPVRFGFTVVKTPVTIDSAVRTGGDYGATVSVANISEVINFLSESVTFWGVPASAAHDEARGWACLAGGTFNAIPTETCVHTHQGTPKPFLTLPSSCAAPFASTVEGRSWPVETSPGVPGPSVALPAFSYSLQDPFGAPVALTRCNQEPFEPSIEAAPDVQEASKPSGLTVHVRVPQEVGENSLGVGSSDVRGITVELPQGMTLNPAGAGGLQGCSNGQIGYEGPRVFPSVPETELLTFTPTLPEPLSPGLELAAKGFCPGASKVGTVKIKSPLIVNPVEGSVYLAAQNQNPFGSLVAMYIVAEDPVSGTLVKLPGRLWLCETAGQVLAGETCGAPGQIVSTFENQPQLPFEDAELHFFGGERAPLSTPAHCGTYTTNATFTPWSGGAPVSAQSHFQITSGPGGGPCPGAALPFSPSLTGGTTNINAGGFSPLTTTIGRQDGNQDMRSVVLHMPAGLEGILAGVKLCPEAQANEGTCPPESQIGETTVQAGVGQQPVFVHGGKVYLTEKYAGAPFGLSIVDPVRTGPFDLEHDTSNPAQNPACDCVVVRAKIEVNPTTAELTITTGEIPRVIDGIPVQIQKVNVLVNREHFTFNPTNCNPTAITGSILGYEGATSPVSVPFQPTNCAVLKFTPTVAVSTAPKASKLNGASLSFNIAYPKGALGTQSWFNEAKFDIPKQLPARLETIQQACLAETFEHDRAACPAHSIIGHAVVHTPVLPVPLEGSVYFVSYGSAKFPDAVLVLDGYGVHVELHGNTFINNKTGVTSATFLNTPDVPFESIEVSIPTGRYSEFGANLPHGALSFCGQKLVMPTLFKAQNGLEIHQNTPVAVTGCRTLTRKQKLAAALKACHKKHGKKRAVCEKAARRAFGARASKRASSTHRATR